MRRFFSILSVFFPLVAGSGEGIGDHEYVEMGDGLKWATCNVGAYDLGFSVTSTGKNMKVIDLGPDFRLYGLSMRPVSE